MAGSSSRPVRIARKPASGSPPKTDAGSSDPAPEHRGNALGTQRGIRLFAVFALVAVGIYVLFTALVASSSSSGLRSDIAVYALLTALVALLLGVGFFVTLGRAPRSIAWGASDLIVRERLGGVRRFPRAGLATAVVYRYPSGLLASGPTELVTVTDARGRYRNYLVERGVLDLEPTAPG